jgi:hypothetical protein
LAQSQKRKGIAAQDDANDGGDGEATEGAHEAHQMSTVEATDEILVQAAFSACLGWLPSADIVGIA